MRILHVNKFGTAETGADKYFVNVAKQLHGSGHDVAVVCMRPRDVPPSIPTFEVPDLDFHQARGLRSKARAVRTVWSGPAAVAAVELAIDEFAPDVVHFHNIAHHLSHRVVAVAKARSLPTFMTCHDYKLVCPAYLALRDGRPCFDCSKGSPTGCAVHRCLHGSVAWSTLGTLEAQRVRLTAESSVPNVLICPSRFMAERFEDSWLDATSTTIVTIPNPVDAVVVAARRSSADGPAIYVGRLSQEKGVDVAIAAAACAGVALVVVGDGPKRAALEALADQLDAPVTFAGFQSGAALDALWESAAFFVAPSTWPENYPLAVLEGLARGLPCVASEIGGLPEIVLRSKAGLLVEPGDVEALACAMQRGAAGEIGNPDVVELRHSHSWPTHLARLDALYEGSMTAA